MGSKNLQVTENIIKTSTHTVKPSQALEPDRLIGGALDPNLKPEILNPAVKEYFKGLEQSKLEKEEHSLVGKQRKALQNQLARGIQHEFQAISQLDHALQHSYKARSPVCLDIVEGKQAFYLVNQRSGTVTSHNKHKVTVELVREDGQRFFLKYSFFASAESKMNASFESLTDVRGQALMPYWC